MTKEEKIKIYAAYLPYNTKVQTHCGQIRELSMVDAEESCVAMTGSNGMSPIETVHENGAGFKLILYDLSYLTKEIEHEGETFVPTERLMNYAFNFGVNRGVFEHMLSSILEGNTLITELPYYLIVKLLEWHLNVFQLPEDQYINKATLTNK